MGLIINSSIYFMRLSKEKIQKEFHDYLLPTTLSSLIDFDNDISDNYYYTEAFELTYRSYYDLALEHTSVRRAFFKAIIPFAQATHSGSFYAFWAKDDTKDLNQAPIVVFGDEGGIHIIADNINELLQIIAIDVEPMVDDEEVFFIDDEEDDYIEEDEEESSSKHIDSFKEWLQRDLNLTPFTKDEIAPAIEKAQQKHQKDFETWLTPLAN